jgi:hypothetical protein
MKKIYNISKFKIEDIKYYELIYKSAFSSIPDLKNVITKFFHKYQEAKPSFIAVSESNEPASFYGIITQRASYNNEIFDIAQSCDSMTHKAHGGQGLFVKVAETAYDFLKVKNINFVYGFPNTVIYDLRKIKLKWEHQENINVYKEKVKTLPFDKIVKKIPFLRIAYYSYLTRVFSKYKSQNSFFSNSLNDKDICCILHDQDYFEYKSSENKFILDINGINFWIKVDGILWVGDFENCTPEKFEAAYQILKKIAKKAGISNIIFHYQEGTSNDKLLKGLINLSSTMPLGYRHLTNEHTAKVFKFAGADFDTW